MDLTDLMPQTLAAKALAAVAAAALLLAAGAYGGYRWELGTYDTLVAQNAATQVKVQKISAKIQQRESATVTTAAVSEGAAQQQIAAKTVTIKEEVTKYVPVIQSCVPVGFVRVLDNAAGVDPSASGIAASQPNDACTSLSWDQIASELADDYGAGNANAEQLNALEATVKAINAEQTAPPTAQ